MPGLYNQPPKNLMFGQFLIEKRKIRQSDLYQALKIQTREKGDLKKSHRLLGTILMEDFGLIKNRLELSQLLKEFEEYREWVEEQHAQLKTLKGGNYE